ncbi:MAG: hypothetical protein JW755_10515 [Candidatus Aminicenantes bacterium]|nr:hypothetical protein [Candidatus Aminicenantes bacterium]
MRKTQTMTFVIILFIFSFFAIYGQELDEHLKLLAPLTNKNWEGDMPRLGEGAKREVIWQIIWNGKAIKLTTEVKILQSITEAYFYWDSNKQEIGVFSITSNGNFYQGHAIDENGKILIYGHITFPDTKLEFRNNFGLTEEGTLIDRWYTFRDGEWTPGHVFELSEKKE